MRILIVEDEVKTRQEIEYYVNRHPQVGLVVSCSNAFEALQQAEQTGFDIALLDIDLPVMNGLELAEKLLSRNVKLQVAFVTAYNHYAAEAFEVNAVDYILKPIREERLFKTLDRLVGLSVSIPEKSTKLSVQTFGRLTVLVGSDQVKWGRRKASEVFAYLLMKHGKLVHKEELCDEIWPELDLEKALASLQTAIWQIRKLVALTVDRQINVEYSENCYRLSMVVDDYDVHTFLGLCERALSGQDDLEAMESAHQLYKGRYLEEEGWLWAMPLQEALDMKHRIVLARILKIYLEMGRYDKVLEHLNQLPSDDPLGDEYRQLLQKAFRRQERVDQAKSVEISRK